MKTTNERLEVFKAILDKVQAMIHLLLALNFGVLILETRGFYEKLNRRKSKGRDTRISQPFKH